jgi:hypothetical protein
VTPTQEIPLYAPIVKFYVGTNALGTRWAGPVTGETYRAEDLVPYPLYNPNDMMIAHDIGLVRLAEPVTGVTPVAINTAALRGNELGAEVLYVGFGSSNGKKQTGSGVKRSTTMPLTWIEDDAYYTEPHGSGTCQGDSGGPGLLQGEDGQWRAIGVVSAGASDPGTAGDPCLEGYGIYSRVDAYASWISEVTGIALPPCGPGTCICDSACRPDGSCDNASCRTVACADAFVGHLACPADDAGCSLDWYLVATTSAASAYQRLTTCLQNKCAAAGTDPIACATGPCGDRLGECLAGAAGTRGCDAFDACRSGCPKDSALCIHVCEALATPEAVAAHAALSACLADSCGLATAAGDLAKPCARSSCGTDLDACFPAPPCDLLGGSCAEGKACRPADGGTTACVASGGLAAGDACADGDAPACGDGLACIAGACAKLCSDGAACADGESCVPGVFPGVDGVGACAAPEPEPVPETDGPDAGASDAAETGGTGGQGGDYLGCAAGPVAPSGWIALLVLLMLAMRRSRQVSVPGPLTEQT